jgi:hypothetical protein
MSHAATTDSPALRLERAMDALLDALVQLLLGAPPHPRVRVDIKSKDVARAPVPEST